MFIEYLRFFKVSKFAINYFCYCCMVHKLSKCFKPGTLFKVILELLISLVTNIKDLFILIDFRNLPSLRSTIIFFNFEISQSKKSI